MPSISPFFLYAWLAEIRPIIRQLLFLFWLNMGIVIPAIILSIFIWKINLLMGVTFSVL